MNGRSLLIAAGALCAPLAISVSMLTLAHAQDRTQPASEEETAPPPPPPPAAIIPRRSDRTPPGIRVEKKAPAAPDWTAVKTTLRVSKEKDAEFDRSVRAMSLSRVISPEERERLRPKALRAAPPEQFKRVSPEAVNRAMLPVLAPATAETIGALRIASRENAFTAFGELPNGANFELIGTRMRVVGGPTELVKARGAQRKRALKRLDSIDAPYMISHHEQGVELSFAKFNVAYQIAVYCDDETDARCAQDDYAISLADSIVILNENAGGQ